MPTRLLTESVCYSKKIEKLTAFAELFFYRLLVNADDYGRMDARPRVLRAKLFPLKDLSLGLVSDALRALTEAGLIDCYEVGGDPYLTVADWEAHQQIRVKREKYPPPPGWRQATSAGEAHPFDGTRADTHAGAAESESESRSESVSVSEKGAPSGPPTRDEVRRFAQEKGYATDPDTFFDFYEAKDWKNNKGKPVVWRAALATWVRNEALWHGDRVREAPKDPAAHSYDPEDFFAAAVAHAYRDEGSAS